MTPPGSTVMLVIVRSPSRHLRCRSHSCASSRGIMILVEDDERQLLPPPENNHLESLHHKIEVKSQAGVLDVVEFILKFV